MPRSGCLNCSHVLDEATIELLLAAELKHYLNSSGPVKTRFGFTNSHACNYFRSLDEKEEKKRWYAYGRLEVDLSDLD